MTPPHSTARKVKMSRQVSLFSIEELEDLIERSVSQLESGEFTSLVDALSDAPEGYNGYLLPPDAMSEVILALNLVEGIIEMRKRMTPKIERQANQG